MHARLSKLARVTAGFTVKPRLVALGRAFAASGLAPGLLVSGLAAVPAEAATVYKAPLRTAVRALAVSAEVNSGYDRNRYFGVWNDANRDCQNTRHEVLVAESKVRPTYTSRACTVTKGRWVTTWDNRVHTSASTVQIDHTVPVAEAWGSGARYWTQARRVAFYKDRKSTRLNSSHANISYA